MNHSRLPFSVILCCHNPRPVYLRRTLAALAAQTLPPSAWEFLLVDNASSSPLAAAVDLRWHPSARHVLEPALGLTNARLCGIREANGELLVFVDDDNELDPAYLENAAQLAAAHPRLGCLGAATIRPEFEAPPAPHLQPHLEYLALRELGEDRWSNRPADGITPWGAGLVVRRDVARRYTDEMQNSPLRRKLDRAGQTLLSGGDDEFSWAACAMGYGKGLFLQLRLTHLIPSERVQLGYLLRLIEGTSTSNAVLRHLHGLPPENDRTPSFLHACGQLGRGRLSHFLVGFNEALIWRRLTPTQRAVATAGLRGKRNARRLIASAIA